MLPSNPKFGDSLKYALRTAGHYVILSLTLIGTFWLAIWLGKGSLSEDSPAGLMQNLLLLINLIFIAILAKRQPAWRGFCWLYGGFFLTLLIRELDQWLDWIVHGFWAYPAALVVIVSLWQTYRHWPQFQQGFVRFTQNNQFFSICAGVILLLVFSRLFGMSELWKTLMADNYIRDVKSFIEEGIELLAYCFLTYANVRFIRHELAHPHPQPDATQD